MTAGKERVAGRGIWRLGLCVAVLALVMSGAAASSSSSTAALATVSVWHMDETSGATMVDSVGSNNGTGSNVTLGVPGLVGTAYAFDGIDSVVVVPDSPSLNPGPSDFSFTLSVRFSVVPAADYDLLRKGLSTTKGGDYKLEAIARQHGLIAQANCLFTGSSGTSHLVAGPDLSNGQWHTITCSKSASAISLTVDDQTFTKSGSVGSITNSAPLTLGAKLKGAKLRDRYVDAMDEVTFSVGT